MTKIRVTQMRGTPGKILFVGQNGDVSEVSIGLDGEALVSDGSTVFFKKITVSNIMLNNGDDVNAGDVLVFDASVENAFKTTDIKTDLRFCGIASEDVLNGGNGVVVSNSGAIIDVNCDEEAVNIGQFLRTSSTKGLATSFGYFRGNGAIAIALSEKAAGSTGSVKVMLIDNFRQAIVGNAGYALGGKAAATTNAGQKFSTPTATWSAVSSANLPVATHDIAGMTYGTNGIFAIGGHTTSYVASAYYMPFATETTSAAGSANLAQARYKLRSSASGDSKGFVLGGYTSGPRAEVDKIDYATSARSAATALSGTRQFQTTLSDGVYGYTRGGYSAAAHKITFSTDAVALSPSADLPAMSDYYTAFSFPASAGYNAYLRTGAPSSRKVSFASGTDAAVSSAPVTESSYASAVGDGISSSWLCGSDVSPYTQSCKFDVAVEVYSSDAGASLLVGAYASAQGSYATYS